MLLSFLLWSLVFLSIAVGLDQLFVRVEMRQPVLAEIRTFHVDFRTRLLHLAVQLRSTEIPATKKKELPSMPKISSTAAKSTVRPSAATGGKGEQPVTTQAAPAESAGNPRYLYTDDKGDLLFADRVEDIPADYRGAAQPLAR